MFKKTKISLTGKSKKNIFLIHGLTGSPGEFLPYLDKLTPHGNVHLISLPGHGKLPFKKKENYSLDYLINSFQYFLKDYKKNEMIFICHSLGGFLLNNKIFSMTKKEDKFFFISPVVSEKLNQKFIGKIINTISKETKRFNLKNTTKEDLREYYQELTNKIYYSSFDYSSQKSKTDSRILSIVGLKDELIVNKENHLILNGGHNLHIENPENILSIILDKI